MIHRREVRELLAAIMPPAGMYRLPNAAWLFHRLLHPLLHPLAAQCGLHLRIRRDALADAPAHFVRLEPRLVHFGAGIDQRRDDTVERRRLRFRPTLAAPCIHRPVQRCAAVCRLADIDLPPVPQQQLHHLGVAAVGGPVQAG